jgi:hypothetical protein
VTTYLLVGNGRDSHTSTGATGSRSERPRGHEQVTETTNPFEAYDADIERQVAELATGLRRDAV